MTDEIIKQEPPQKKFNWANLPIILVISLFSLFVIIENFLGDDDFLIFICLIFISALICPVSLIFQCINKNKTIIDKVLLGINIIFSIIFCIYFILILLLLFALED